MKRTMFVLWNTQTESLATSREAFGGCITWFALNRVVQLRNEWLSHMNWPFRWIDVKTIH